MWWLWTLIALAGPVTGETPTVPTALPLPAGVTLSPSARELASRPRSAAVTFAIAGRPEIRDGRLVVRGVLTNAGTRPTTVYLEDAANTGGPFVLQPEGATFTRTAPEAPRSGPSPVELVLPAGAQVPYESALVLDAWTWPEGGATVSWSFRFWTAPVSGTLEGKLAPPAPRP